MQRIIFILYVNDQRLSRDFYQTTLRRDPTLDVPGMTEFHLGGTTYLGLMPEAGIHRLLGDAITHPAEAKGIPRAEVYLHLSDPQAVLDRALAAGASLISELKPRDWGDRVAYVRDPDGHILALATPHSED